MEKHPPSSEGQLGWPQVTNGPCPRSSKSDTNVASEQENLIEGKLEV